MKALLTTLLFIFTFTTCSLATNEKNYPRLLVTDGEREQIINKIEEKKWAARIYDDMTDRVTPYVERHQKNPEWILSRYQMNWEPGAHYTTHISDPVGTELIDRGGNAPYPTVRVTTHKRPPVAPDGYRYRAPALEDIKPFDTDSLWYMQSSGPGGEWSWAEPRQHTRVINGRINSLAVESAIIFWLTGDKSYARFASDILFQWARGAYYQDPVEGAGRTGLFCIQSLGDRSYDNLAIAYDFVRDFMKDTDYETRFLQPVFEKMAQTTKRRGFITNNWYAAQTTTLAYTALSLDDPEKQDYYLSFYLERDTIIGNFGQLGLPTTMEMHFTHDGHWKENAGYHDMPVGDLLQAAVPVDNNGYAVLERHPALFEASYAMLRYSFPNLQLMGYGDIGGWRHQSPRNLEIAIRFAADYEPSLLPGLMASMNRLIDTGLYDRARSGWYGLLVYLADLPETEVQVFEWDRAFELDFARLYGQRNGTDQETGLMYYVQGATYNHNHANGMAMELYGRGYVMGADPGISATYEDSVFVHYLATFASHNTVIAAGASEPSEPFTGSGGAKHMGEISLSIMEPAAGKEGLSPYTSFTETDYLEPSTATKQQRLMGIIRTSDETGYYVDFYRSDNEISNDYLYHNIGHEVTLSDMSRNLLELQSDSIPYREDRQSGMAWFEEIKTPASPVTGAIATFRVQETDQDDAYMQMLMPLDTGDKVFTAVGPRTQTAPAGIRELPTPKAIIHRQKTAWNHPFGVIYEPYRGAEGYSVQSAERIATGSSLAALRVKNRDGSHQLIMQSDQPGILQHARTGKRSGDITIKGNYGVISVYEDNDLQYMYLGHGQSVTWNDYSIVSDDPDNTVFVELSDNALTVSNKVQFTMHIPHRVTRVNDEKGNSVSVETDGDSSIITFTPGENKRYHLYRD